MQSVKTKQQVIDYYTKTEIDYRLVWHLGSERAMHFGFWDGSTHSLRQALRNENIILARQASISKTDRVLDAGCGVGGSSLFLAREIGCSATGISLVPSQIKQATQAAKDQRLAGQAHFRVADFTATPFTGESYDVVWPSRASATLTIKNCS